MPDSEQTLQPHRPLTVEERTDVLLDEDDGDVTLICGCTFWRTMTSVSFEAAIMVSWCERHTPLHMYEDAGVESIEFHRCAAAIERGEHNE